MAGSQDFTADPRNANALIYLNGELVRREQAKVSIFDGGFVVGDGVWEGLRLHKGVLLFLDQHLDRLYWGANRIGLDIGLDRKALTAEIRRILDANGMRDGVHLRVMATRGEKSAPNQDPRNALGKATLVIVAEYKSPNPQIMTKGLSLFTSSIRCTPAEMFGIFAQTAESVYSRGYVLTVELRYRYTLAFERPYSFMSALISAP